jgi:hypothetical protein
MSEMFDALYPDTAVPKSAWRWIESAQYRLLRHGAHRALSAVDLLICATAAQHDLVVLDDDKDFATAAQYLPDMRERSVYDTPPAGPRGSVAGQAGEHGGGARGPAVARF